MVAHPHLENLLFRRAEAMVKCTFAGQLSGPRTIRELLLLKEKAADAKISLDNL